MSIVGQKALEAYPKDYAYTKCDEDETNYSEIDADGIKWLKVDINKTNRVCYIKGYDQATKDVLEWLEKNIPCGEMSHGIVLDVIQECKLYFEGEV